MVQPKEAWLQSIAVRAKVEVSLVEAVLATHRIQPAPVLASPRRLVLRELEFSGVKDSVADAGPFRFHWNDLGPGLWAMLTEQNLRGKSSIIEVARWLVRGRPSPNLQDDVRRWIHSVRLRFMLDAVEYEVAAKTQDDPIGSLSVVRPSEADLSGLANFTNDDEFEAVMADFFMRAFAMEPISTWRQGTDEEGQAITHSWVAFSGAMFIGTSYEVLLGDMPVQSGLNPRLIEMYLGVPWVSTLAAAKSAQKTVEQVIEAATRRMEQGQQAARSRVNDINSQLITKRNELALLPSDQAVRDALAADAAELVQVRRAERDMAERLEIATAALREAEVACLEDRRDVQTHLDSMSASAVFRRLDPTCCPRCDHAIEKAKKEKERLTHACSVCGESVASSEDGEAIKVELDARVAASQAASKRAKKNKDEATDELIKLGNRVEQLQNQIESSSKQLGSYVRRQELATSIAVLEGRLEEADLPPLNPVENRAGELAVLNAVVAETDGRVRETRDGLLGDVSARLLHYAQDFGMHSLTGAALKGNASLSLKKGGVQTSYSKVTEGEKLRLKVATILAMIEVAEARGIGRHPGLLMIDSPAAQEVSLVDVEHLVYGLQAVSRELPHLQVFVAGLTSKAITDHIPKTNRCEVAGNEFLW